MPPRHADCRERLPAHPQAVLHWRYGSATRVTTMSADRRSRLTAGPYDVTEHNGTWT